MAGGIGSRFWPMSTPEYPKQFVDVMGCGRTMLQATVDRFLPLCPAGNLWIVTGAGYFDLVRAQLPEIPVDNIIQEPCARSTAPCISYACWKIMAKDPDANLVITPSDAYVENVEEYRRIISAALDFTATDRRIVTIGIKPTRPETGYGYIAAGECVTDEIREVDSFREKPDLQTAKQYLEAGNYLWNAGIFVWNVGTIVQSIRQFTPELAAKMDQMAKAFYTPDEASVVADIFPTCEKISIDYAVMEKADYIYTFPADFGWSDVGTWGSVYQHSRKDRYANAVPAEGCYLYDTRSSIVQLPKDKIAVISGLKEYIVVDTEDVLMICPRSEEQSIKKFIDEVKFHNGEKHI